MKNLLLSFFILFWINIYSQNTIFLKDGTSIIPKGNDIRTNLGDRSITYFKEGSSWGKTVKYKDLDYVTIDGKLLKCLGLIEIGKKKPTEPQVYFVLIETKEYRLVTIQYDTGVVHVQYVAIIDKDNKILANKSCISGTTKKDVEKRKETAELIRTYFSNLDEEIAYLDYCKSQDTNDSIGLFQFLNTHLYKKYD